MNRSQNNTGFTLIEILIAMAMIATIVSMVYGSYAATSQSLQRYDGQLKCSGRANLVLRLMARQIRGAYAPPTDANTPTNNQANPAQPGKALVEKRLPVFQGNAQDPRGQFLRFVTTAGLGTAMNTPRGLGQISYRYDAAAGTLAISSRPYMDRLTEQDPTAPWRNLLENVTALDIEFHDGRKWRQKWSTRQDKLPRAVRIRLVVLDEKDRPYHLGTTVSVVSRATSVRKTSRSRTGVRRP
jgi:type II secretion system protein J